MARSIRCISILAIVGTICSSRSLAQLTSKRCDPVMDGLVQCQFRTESELEQATGPETANLPSVTALSAHVMPVRNLRVYSSSKANSDVEAPPVTAVSKESAKERFQWRQALQESFTFLTIEQAYVVHDDFKWVVVENGIPFNHYWRDYKQSLSTWIHSGWNDGDPNLYGYVGHPIQGAVTSYIQIQNDPKSRNLEF